MDKRGCVSNRHDMTIEGLVVNSNKERADGEMGYPRSSKKNLSMVTVARPGFEENEDGILDSYITWQNKHPSALENFEQLMNSAKGKKIVVFLDYDGTLSPIVDDPNQAFMSEKMRSAVREVACCFPTAIISGRRLEMVRGFVQLNNVYYAGSHGMDIAAPLPSQKFGQSRYQTKVVDEKGEEIVYFQPALDFLPSIEKILEELNDQISAIRGAVIENNRFCISVHFRHVHQEDLFILEDLLKRIMENYSQFCIKRGKKVVEIRPSIKWDKGYALEYILDALGLNGSNDVLPVYIGDDQTDEDAFKVINRMTHGYPIVVSSIPKETDAVYSLRDPSDVKSFLLRLAKWRRRCSF